MTCGSRPYAFRVRTPAMASSAVEEAPTLVRLWVHESLRVFADRLTDDPDRATFFETVKTLTEKHFGTKFNKVFSHLDKDEDGDVDLTELRRLMFGNFLVPGADPMTYQEVTQYDALKNVVALAVGFMDGPRGALAARDPC